MTLFKIIKNLRSGFIKLSSKLHIFYKLITARLDDINLPLL